MSLETEQCCGTCEYLKNIQRDYATLDYYGRCTCPIPQWVPFDWGNNEMFEYQGKNCLCYKEK